MTDIKIEYLLEDVDERHIDRIIASWKKYHDSAKVTVVRPWPKMKLGDTFKFDDNEYIFITYMTREKIRAVPKEPLLADAVIQPSYFDCTKITDRVKFHNK